MREGNGDERKGLEIEAREANKNGVRQASEHEKGGERKEEEPTARSEKSKGERKRKSKKESKERGDTSPRGKKLDMPIPDTKRYQSMFTEPKHPHIPLQGHIPITALRAVFHRLENQLAAATKPVAQDCCTTRATPLAVLATTEAMMAGSPLGR